LFIPEIEQNLRIDFGQSENRRTVDFRTGDRGNERIQKVDQHPQHPGFALPAQTQKQHVVQRQHGVLDLRQDRIFVADDARKQGLTRGEFCQQVFTHAEVVFLNLALRTLYRFRDHAVL